MRKTFEVASGTVIGKLHTASGRNNQDSFSTIHTDDFLIGVVSDGCGSEPDSEVGSKLGCQMLAEIISRRMDLFQNSGLKITEILTPKFWDNAEEELCSRLKHLSGMLGKNAVANFFLFTLVGFVMAKTESLFFSLGDGIIIINGEITIIGPFPENAPPYLGYNILATDQINPALDLKTLDSTIQKNKNRSATVWQDCEVFKSGVKQKNKVTVQKIIDTQSIESILVGTDGVEHLIKAENEKIPGKNELVGSISQFWTENCFFENQDMARRRLTIINRTYIKLNRDKDALIREYGHLPDDTTLITVRRKNQKMD